MKVMFLPLHTTSLTQPRDQAVVYIFKKLYQKLPFNVTFVTVNNPFHDLWKFYTNMHSIINIQAVKGSYQGIHYGWCLREDVAGVYAQLWWI
jgi:hypothetical protein